MNPNGLAQTTADALPGRINWTCSTCQRPTRFGALHIDLQEVNRAERARKDWDRRDRGADAPVLQLSDLFRMPPLAHWRVECDGCRHQCVGCYSIDLTQCQSAFALIKWTQHLYGKTWFGATDWVHFIAGVARANGSPTDPTGVW